jgi:hypothetical protein
MSWRSALAKLLETTYDWARTEGLDWTVVGSGATALQGCQVSPHDLDVITRVPEHVFRFAELMHPFAARECAAESPENGPWWSTAETPVYVGSYWGLDWHYACWDINEFLVSVVHVVAPGGHPGFRGSGGVWECDPRVWPHIKTAGFVGQPVPVVPLEVQLETIMARGTDFEGRSLEPRLVEMVRVLRQTGYDRSLLEWALRDEHIRRFDALIDTPT